jgi:ribosomal subunit interface protein
MSIEVTSRHKDISDRLQDYARGKAAAIEAEYQKTSSVKVVLDFDRHIYRAHFTATVDGIQFDAEADDSENIVKAIDDAADKANRQIRKQLDKMGDNRK